MSARPAPDQVAVRSVGHQLTFQDLDSDRLGLRQQVTPGAIARLSTDDTGTVAAALIALDGWADEVQFVPPDVEIDTDATPIAPQTRGDEAAPVPARLAKPTRWRLFTSGTTGEPKAIVHTTASLTRTIVAGACDGYVWGQLYDPNRMAGLQVILQALHSGATIVAPDLHANLATRIRELIDSGVNAVSATPSLWRQILQLPDIDSWPVRQITLGGEIADQRILDALTSRFASARVVHVFASTETGAAFSVKDGRAGFPVSYLNDPPRDIRLEIRADILHVHSPGVSAAGPDGFASTGDIVEVIDDRILFRGRASGVVNVGGADVWPETVETILRRHPDVVDAVVGSKPNSMIGNVLIATVTLAPTAEVDGVTKRLRSWVREQAPKSHVPASVTVVDKLEVSATGKALR